ncbi:MAG: hypothetical protein KF785_05405 [Gemmatimonadales bacterium]|nr:hypothetical protein [Gemmatimonadales bacterium]
MSKAPNLMVRSLMATGGILLLKAARLGLTTPGGEPIRPALTALILTAVFIGVVGLLAGLLLHWGWPRTRSRAAGALLGAATASAFLAMGALALGIWSAWPLLVSVAVVLGGGLLVGGAIGARAWPPRGSQRLSGADLIVGREDGFGKR